MESFTVDRSGEGGGFVHFCLSQDKDYPLKQWTYVAYQIRGSEPIEEAPIVNGLRISMGKGSREMGFSDTPDQTFIGGRPGCESLIGWIDEVRISKGWRYSVPSIFTPVKRFEADERTLAIWHFYEGPSATYYADSSGNVYKLIRVRTLAVSKIQKLSTTWAKLKE